MSGILDIIKKGFIVLISTTAVIGFFGGGLVLFLWILSKVVN